jgi:RNA polymerase sigma-70 factor (ECF subfamily)
LDAWVAETLPLALAFAVSLLGNRTDAEDIVQDCYSRLLAKSDQYDLPRDGSRLLLKSISNASINLVQRRRPTVSLDAAIGAAVSRSDPEQGVAHQELEVAVAEALASLPVNQRAVVELRSLGHSLLEIADMLEISHANARVLLHRARQQLAHALAPFLEENVR